MSAQPEKGDLTGLSCTLNGNESIILDDPQTVWLVRSGALNRLLNSDSSWRPRGSASLSVSCKCWTGNVLNVINRI